MPRTTSLRPFPTVSVGLKFPVELNSNSDGNFNSKDFGKNRGCTLATNSKPHSVKIIIYIRKGKGRTGDIEVHFKVKEKCERFSEGKDFTDFGGFS